MNKKFALYSLCLLIFSCLMTETVLAQGEIKLTTGDNGWFIVEGLKGTNISVEGMPNDFQVRVQGAKETGFKQVYQAPTNSEVTFKGDIKYLRISCVMDRAVTGKRADIVKIDLSKAPKSLRSLSLKGLNFKGQAGEFDFSGATELVALSLIDLSNNVTLPLIDLSKQTKLKTLYLGNKNENNNYLKKVVLPQTNAIKQFDMSRCTIQEINLDVLKDVVYFHADATISPKLVDLTPYKKIERLYSYRSHIDTYIGKDLPELYHVPFEGNNGSTIYFENCPKLREWHPYKGKDGKTYYTGLHLGLTPNPMLFTKVTLINTGFTVFGGKLTAGLNKLKELTLKSELIKKLDCRTIPKTAEKIKIEIPNVRKLCVFESQFTLDWFVDIVNALPTVSDGTAKVFRYTDPQARSTFRATKEEVEKILKEKGWVIEDVPAGTDPEEGKEKPTAVDNLANKNIKIFPTQTKDFVYIQGAKASTSYAVYNAGGKLCFEGQISSGEERLDFSSLAKGLYILKIGSIREKIILI